MRVGIVNTFDVYGGAARTASRLHKGLIAQSINSKMIVQIKESDNKLVVGPGSKYEKLRSSIVSNLSNIPLALYPNKDSRTFSTGIFRSLNLDKYNKEFDILNLHWIANGFQSVNSIEQIKLPLVLSLHDSWAFTGGCHVPYECVNFVDSCGNCGCLGSNNKKDLSYHILSRKKKAWSNNNMVLVAASKWIADNAKKSSLFNSHRVEVVNPGLDLEVFKPVDKQLSRKILGFSDDDIIILFGAISATSDFNKGFHLLLPALQRLQSTLPNLKLVVFGSDDSGENLINIDIPIKYVGRLHDDISLTILYSSADVMVVPSIQEAFGQTASESFACGTPVVAFGASGLIDIIDHKVNGYLAKPYDSVDLAEGIKWVIEDKDRNFNLSLKARMKAMNNFGLDRFVNKYVDIYNSIINKGK